MKNNKNKVSNGQDLLIENLEAIKRLLVLQLRMLGVTSEDIGKTLGVDSSTVRHMASLKNSKKSDN